jgi:hypothetical protein
MLDFDLAEMYEVEARMLNQAVKRNAKRFSVDFMFRLTATEWETMRSQFVTALEESGPMSSQFVMTYPGKRPKTALPFAFTEQGLAMLSGILNSDKAINVNIAIMRAFVFLRQYAISHKDLSEKLKEIETKYDKQFSDVYEAINYLLEKDKQDTEIKERRKIGYMP